MPVPEVKSEKKYVDRYGVEESKCQQRDGYVMVLFHGLFPPLVYIDSFLLFFILSVFLHSGKMKIRSNSGSNRDRIK